ncbi:stability/ partitioning determinant [Escherichia coli]|uniref:stability/ partitioning determinant n=1 Tax=Escherichia coli TaxID=562 RepID=UPI00202E85EF|nr:stability/ partitioning determinant [Escherichia coli]
MEISVRAKEGRYRELYRLNQSFIDVMEADALRTALRNTDILKAALAAWSHMDDATKNHWLFESAKM